MPPLLEDCASLLYSGRNLRKPLALAGEMEAEELAVISHTRIIRLDIFHTQPAQWASVLRKPIRAMPLPTLGEPTARQETLLSLELLPAQVVLSGLI